MRLIRIKFYFLCVVYVNKIEYHTNLYLNYYFFFFMYSTNMYCILLSCNKVDSIISNKYN